MSIINNTLNLIEEGRARKAQRAISLGQISHAGPSSIIGKKIISSNKSKVPPSSTSTTLNDLYFEPTGKSYSNATKNKFAGYQYGDTTYGFSTNNIKKSRRAFGSSDKLKVDRRVDNITDPYLTVSHNNPNKTQADTNYASYIVTPTALKTTKEGGQYIDLDTLKKLQEAKKRSKEGGPQLVTYNKKYNEDGTQKVDLPLETAFNRNAKTQKLRKHDYESEEYGEQLDSKRKEFGKKYNLNDEQQNNLRISLGGRRYSSYKRDPGIRALLDVPEKRQDYNELLQTHRKIRSIIRDEDALHKWNR